MTIGVHAFWAFMLIFSRMTALFVTAPVFSARFAPAHVKVALAGLLSFALLPVVEPMTQKVPADLVTLAGQIFAETMVGLCIGLIVQLIFTSLQIAGAFSDTQIGFNMINTLNPVSDVQSSATGALFYQLGITLFLIMGGHLFLIRTIADSYLTVGPGAAHFIGDISGVMVGLVGEMFMLAFRIAAPVAGVLLVVDVAFAIIARTVPQISIFIVGMPVKVIVGLTTVALVLPVVAIVISQFIPVISSGTHSALQAVR